MLYISSEVVLADVAGDLRPDGPLVGYRTLLTVSNVSADEEAAGFPASNLANPSTAEKWKGTTDDPQFITVHLGSPQACDYIGIARHNLGTIGCTIQIQASVDGDTWEDLGDDFIPGDDAPIMVRFEDSNGPYFRLSLTPGSGVPEMAVLYLGKLLVLQRNIYVGHSPITYNYTNTVSVGLSESGEFLGGVARRANPSTDVKQANLTAAWFRAYMAPFFKQCVGNAADRQRTPFFFAWRPTSFPDEVAFGWFPEGSAPSASNARPNGMMDANFSIQGIL